MGISAGMAVPGVFLTDLEHMNARGFTLCTQFYMHMIIARNSLRLMHDNWLYSMSTLFGNLRPI